MRFINKLTNAARQKFVLVGEGGQQIMFTLYFMPRENSWFFDLSWDGFTANGIRMGLSPNILRTFRNRINFGLAIVSKDGFDPNSINDFITGRVQVYILNAADVQDIENGFF